MLEFVNPESPSVESPSAASRTLAVWALILGILTLVVAVVPFANFGAWLVAIAALVLGIVSLVKRRGGRGMAITGIVLSVLGAILSIVMVLVYSAVFIFSAISSDGDVAPSSTPTATPTAEPTGDGAAGGDGTEESPFALGTPFDVEGMAGGTWTITVDDAEFDAGDAVDNPNDDGVPADEAPQYALLHVTLEYDGSGTSLVPQMELQFGYAGTGETVWGIPSSDITTPAESFATLSSMEPGDSATVDVVIALPQGTQTGGTWAVSTTASDTVLYVG